MVCLGPRRLRVFAFNDEELVMRLGLLVVSLCLVSLETVADESKWFPDQFDRFLKCELLDANRLERRGDRYGRSIELAVRNSDLESWIAEKVIYVSASKGETGKYGDEVMRSVELTWDFRHLYVETTSEPKTFININRADLTADGTFFSSSSFTKIEGTCEIVPSEEAFLWTSVENQI